MPDNAKITVLIADDEPSTRALVASHLKRRGYRVIEASDGDEAWELAHEHLPDIVVLDVMMPGMSGWEVCRKIREAVSLAHTGVIMLTGIGENLNEMTSPLYGADAHIDKPFDFGELDRKIKETLARRRAGALGRSEEDNEGVVTSAAKAARERSTTLRVPAGPKPKAKADAKASAKSATAKKTKPAAKRAAKQIAKRPAAKKSVAKKGVAKKSAVKKSAAKKSAAKKSAAKKKR